MSTITQHIGLTKPDYTDEIYQTIQDLGTNFEKLDHLAEKSSSLAPLDGVWPLAARIWNTAPATGKPAGWINTREGRAAKSWKPTTLHDLHSYVVPTTDNGHVYECIQAGYTGVLEPVFPTTDLAEVQDTRGASTWQPSTLYYKDNIVFPTTDIGRFYVCVKDGESGSKEPVWSSINGASVYDNTAVWISLKVAKWAERGVAASFKPFGMIG
ncbi:hypothetical protein MH117_03065 [Paenibacillus sp. ACRRX]|uniref:hypothetical protein n=1 Tax=Paenibacillus sp. ACRRX TaxID=2918206 RepID=UPI001EF3F674|nr:hypothetical protein [Paenibacillus sp. ACRRX]MCG7406383.1 hypothetical protein [Paenibacillus sp. ACRRX]